MKERILLVEDDAVLAHTIAYNLRQVGYSVETALCVAEAEERIAPSGATLSLSVMERPFSLALLDVNLPDGDGFSLCALIRAQQPDALVLFLTANDGEADQIRGYELGAVDYITKPFYIGALLYKVRALLNMTKRDADQRAIYDDGRIMVDFTTQQVQIDGQSLSFTAMELRVLQLFCQHPKQVLTRRQLLERLWDSDGRFVCEHTLTATVSRIRGKLEAAGAVGAIRTVYGMGYQWMGGDALCSEKDLQ